MSQTGEVDGIIMGNDDNVGTLFRTVSPGEKILLALGDGKISLRIEEKIDLGHKCALTNIESSGKIIKYGEKIGYATSPIAKGTHVHTHNVKSYHGRGDRRK